MKYMEQAIKEIFEILEYKQKFTRHDKALIKAVIIDLFKENKKLKENNNE